MSKYVLAFTFFLLPLLFSPLLGQQKRGTAQTKRNVIQQPRRNVTQQPRRNVENNPIAKLNTEQKRHLKVYRDISKNVASGSNVNRKAIFQQYYELFSSSADELVGANRDKADEMKIRASEALDANNEALSKKCNEAAALYNAMADEIVKLPELYKAGKKAQIDASLKIYLAKEADLIKLGARPCPRRWLTAKEAEACLVALNRTTAKTTR